MRERLERRETLYKGHRVMRRMRDACKSVTKQLYLHEKQLKRVPVASVEGRMRAKGSFQTLQASNHCVVRLLCVIAHVIQRERRERHVRATAKERQRHASQRESHTRDDESSSKGEDDVVVLAIRQLTHLQ